MKGKYPPCNTCKKKNYQENNCYFRNKRCNICKRTNNQEKRMLLPWQGSLQELQEVWVYKEKHQANSIEESSNKDGTFYTYNVVTEEEE